MNKICDTCKKEKDETHFYKVPRLNGNFYFLKYCSDCYREKRRPYNHKKYLKIKNEIMAKRKLNMGPIREAQKRYRDKNKNNLEWREKKRASVRKSNGTEQAKAKRKIWWQKHKNLPHVKEQRRLQAQKRRNKYIQVKIRDLLSGSLYKALKRQGCKKTKSVLIYLGCTIEEFKAYIATKFTDGMSWEIHGRGLHLDHIIPCAAFDLTKEEERHKCFHYTNYQPLWAEDNLKKRDYLPNGERASLIKKNLTNRTGLIAANFPSYHPNFTQNLPILAESNLTSPANSDIL